MARSCWQCGDAIGGGYRQNVTRDGTVVRPIKWNNKEIKFMDEDGNVYEKHEQQSVFVKERKAHSGRKKTAGSSGCGRPSQGVAYWPIGKWAGGDTKK